MIPAGMPTPVSGTQIPSSLSTGGAVGTVALAAASVAAIALVQAQVPSVQRIAVVTQLSSFSPRQQERRKKLDALIAETANPGWDLENGRAIARERWDRVSALMALIAGLVPSAPEPFIAPCGDGTIHVEWTGADRRRFLAELGDAYISWSARRIDGTRLRGECADPAELTDLVRQHVA